MPVGGETSGPSSLSKIIASLCLSNARWVEGNLNLKTSLWQMSVNYKKFIPSLFLRQEKNNSSQQVNQRSNRLKMSLTSGEDKQNCFILILLISVVVKGFLLFCFSNSPSLSVTAPDEGFTEMNFTRMASESEVFNMLYLFTCFICFNGYQKSKQTCCWCRREADTGCVPAVRFVYLINWQKKVVFNRKVKASVSSWCF